MRQKKRNGVLIERVCIGMEISLFFFAFLFFSLVLYYQSSQLMICLYLLGPRLTVVIDGSVAGSVA